MMTMDDVTSSSYNSYSDTMSMTSQSSNTNDTNDMLSDNDEFPLTPTSTNAAIITSSSTQTWNANKTTAKARTKKTKHSETAIEDDDGDGCENSDNHYYNKTLKKTNQNSTMIRNGVYISYRKLIGLSLLLVVFMMIMCLLAVSFVVYVQQRHGDHISNSIFSNRRQRRHSHTDSNTQSLYLLRTAHTHAQHNQIQTTQLDNNNDDTTAQQQCRWYLAESAIPQSGLGIYSGISLHKDDMIGYPDICIYVADGPTQWTHLRSHSFGKGSFFGQYDGYNHNNRAACEGLITTVNTVPDEQVNMIMISPILATNAGLHRNTSPGAGAITYHYGIHGKAITTITAGSEITIDYGDWDFENQEEDSKTYRTKPSRDLTWLQQHGWCIDNIYIDISTIPHAGRGAFARIPMKAGTVVAPAPLQVFEDRALFQSQQPDPNDPDQTITTEQLYVNYCIQPAGSKMLLYPYGQGVNLINHSYKEPNVELRWSTNTRNNMHHAEYLDLSQHEFWEMIAPGKLILEVVAIRDIAPDEEIVLNYGTAWEIAWKAHVQNWIPPIRSEEYVYASEIDETLPIRTVSEQLIDPYPNNLITMCITNDFDRSEGNHVEWSEPDYTNEESNSWAEWMTFCHVLNRTHDNTIGDDLYTVSLLFTSDPKRLDFHPNMTSTIDAYNELNIDYNVPRRAIRFIEKPYMDDEHLITAFRHPIELPIHLVPESWKDQ